MTEEKVKKLGHISLDQKSLYDDYLKRHPTDLSEQTFTNLFMWRKSRPLKTIEVSNTLLTYEEWDDGTILFGTPIGPMSLGDAVSILRDLTDKEVALCDRVSKRVVDSDTPDSFDISEERNYFDYIYRQKDLADLEGRRYSRKRNLISQCLASNKCEYEEITGDNIAQVSAMMDRWCDHKGCQDDRGLCNEFRATRELLQNYSALSVAGAAIRIDGRIVAFTVGEALNENTAVIHLEKAMPEFKGLYQLINQWFCKNHLNSFEFVNREQDVGIPGLRQAKESYYPEQLVRKYRVYPYGKEKGRLSEPPEFKRCLDEEG